MLPTPSLPAYGLDKNQNMGETLVLHRRASRPLDPEVEVQLERIADPCERERTRRVLVYGGDDVVTPGLRRILGLYPMFKLTHAKRARRCLFCTRHIAPLELHFVYGSSYVCQSGTCMDTAAKPQLRVLRE